MELLSPAGNFAAALAAINNGADAVYLGGKDFNARQSAENFNEEELARILEYAHLRGKKIYITLNTLIDNSEFAKALDYVYKLQNLGVDALIMQDMGLLVAVRTIFPHLRIHASTQMTIHNQGGLDLLADLGVKRVVLAREMSWGDLQRLNEHHSDIETEVFVHGALCYSYSGQCLFSSMVGGRSGNRGRCAQPCRLPYEFSSVNNKGSGKNVRGNYLLSPADLCLIEHLNDLARVGVTSLKIEGRMKRPEYVAIVTRTYREILDRVNQNIGTQPDNNQKEELLKIFNRNFSTGYLYPPYENFLSYNQPNNQGTCVGQVIKAEKGIIEIKLTEAVVPGDGLIIRSGTDNSFIVNIEEFYLNGQRTQQAAAHTIITFKSPVEVHKNDKIFKTRDQKLLNQAQATIESQAQDKFPLKARIVMKNGQRLYLRLQDPQENIGESWSAGVLTPAEQRPLTKELLREKIGRMGNTSFYLADLDIEGDDNVIIPFSQLNEMRRLAIDSLLENYKLSAGKLGIKVYEKNKKEYLQSLLPSKAEENAQLSVMVSSVAQAYAAIESGADQVYVSLEGLGNKRKISKDQYLSLAEYAHQKKTSLTMAMPRICKPTDQSYQDTIMGWGCNNVLIANWGDLKWAKESGLKFSCNYNLNIFNKWTLNYLLKQGAAGVCLSPELNISQLQKFPAFDKVELLIHGELIIMQSQYCLIRGLMQPEKSIKCQGYCRQADYYLKDGKGYAFPLATDNDCRLYIFNSRTLCLIDKLKDILKLRPLKVRIEGQRLNEEQIKKTVTIYKQAINNYYKQKADKTDSYKQELLSISNSPFTKGHYYRGVL